MPDGEWYWRVRVEDPAPIGSWSTTYHFVKTWATPENRPELLYPAEGERLAFFDAPAFSWTAVSGAVQYLFEIAENPTDFSTPVISINTITTIYQPGDLLPNSTYYWRVSPIDPSGQRGTPSQVQSFVMSYGSQTIEGMIPTLLEPPDESSMMFTPKFHWTAVDGAEQYRLEYTSDRFCDFRNGTVTETHQTYFTPVTTIADGNRYCWRVRAEAGLAIGDWSTTGHFKKDWSIKPVLLTPTNWYQTGLYPIYSWTPVPGASHYLIEISLSADFDPIFETNDTANTTYSPQNKYDGSAYYYWRVTPIDSWGVYGETSNVGEFQSLYNSLAPILIYPQFYYQPADINGVVMNPHEDRSAPLPIFIWHKVMVGPPNGGVYATAYRIQVDDSSIFDSIDWQYDTENTSASPTTSEPFTPLNGQKYYWRVCPLDYLYDGECEVNPTTDLPWWSQAWTAKFDSTRILTPTIQASPILLRPTVGQESVEATPLLEWWPMQGASEYQVQAGRDSDFSSSVISQTVTIPAYSPKYSLAQRSLDRINYGTYYWHVRGRTSEGWSDWSETWRFQIASQSEWRTIRIAGEEINRLLIGGDPSGDSPGSYDLSTLYASQSSTDWYFGFNVNLSNADISYVLYLDLDNINGSGATTPPEREYQVWTNPEHQPEYAVYVDIINGTINSQNTWVYAWDGESWGDGYRLSEIGGSLFYELGFAELEIPADSIGMTQETGSASVILFSVNNNDNILRDSVPSDPNVPGSSILTHFSTVSDRMNLIYPPSNSTGDPSTFATIMPFYWDWPTGSAGTTPYAGSNLQVDLDPSFTPPHEAIFQVNSNTSYFSENNITLLSDILGDQTYFWRVQARYLQEGYPESYGAWTSGWSFIRKGYSPKNLHTSTVNSILLFDWDLAEGADSYQLQIASDPEFTDLVLDTTAPQNSYAIQTVIPQGHYYWRVRILRYEQIESDWSVGLPFDFTLPSPDGLNPNYDEPIQGSPTLCWDPVILFDDFGNAEFAAWKYHIEVSDDPSFAYIYDFVDTANHCWTSNKGYLDGIYYWRVAIYNGNRQSGPYSSVASFTKQHPSPSLVSPIEAHLLTTPSFVWDSKEGTASYIFEVSRFPTFQPVYDAVETYSTRYTPTRLYDTDRIYYWRVATRDADGVEGSYSMSWFIFGKVWFTSLPVIHR